MTRANKAFSEISLILQKENNSPLIITETLNVAIESWKNKCTMMKFFLSLIFVFTIHLTIVELVSYSVFAVTVLSALSHIVQTQISFYYIRTFSLKLIIPVFGDENMLSTKLFRTKITALTYLVKFWNTFTMAIWCFIAHGKKYRDLLLTPGSNVFLETNLHIELDFGCIFLLSTPEYISR